MNERKIHNAYRDPLSNAVIITDDDGYQSARVRKKMNQIRKKEKDKVEALENRLNDIETKFDSKLDAILQLLEKR